MRRRTLDIALILTVLVGAFLLLDGLSGIIHADSLAGRFGRAFGAQGSTVALIVAIIELLAGALLLIGLIVDLGQMGRLLGIAVLVIWVAVMVIRFVINWFEPDTLNWWVQLVEYSIILAVIWQVKIARE